MTKALRTPLGFWIAKYVGRDGSWITAADGRGNTIRCETEQLALSVAAMRRTRLNPFN